MKAAAPYERKTRPVLPAMELIATIANRDPGEDGLYITRQSPATIDRYLAAARRIHALLVLDIQPGRAGFLSETRRLREWLREPDVALALDPEWHVGRGPGPGPGHRVGRREHRRPRSAPSSRRSSAGDNLPEKLLLVHQFTEA